MVRGRTARRLRPVRRPGAGRGRGHGAGTDLGTARGRRRQRRHREGGIVVARDDSQDPPRPGDRDAPADPDHLPGGFRGREPALPGRRVPRAVRRGADLLLQLDHAPLPAGAADRRRDGSVHRGRRLPAGPVGRDLHGRRHVVHGTGGTQSREGRDGTGGGRGVARRCPHAHQRQRRGALPHERRQGLPRAHPRVRIAAPPAGPPPGAGRQAQAQPQGPVRPAPVGPSHELRHARRARVPAGRRGIGRVPGRRGPRDDLRARGHRGTPRGAHRQLPRRDQGQSGRGPENRRHHLHGERRESRLLRRQRGPGTDPAALRAGRVGLHGRNGSRAFGHHPGRRPLRGSDGDRHGAQTGPHTEPRFGRGLLRHGGAGLRPRFHRLVADRPDGRDGRRVRRPGRVRERRGQDGERRGRGGDARRLRAPAGRPVCRRPGLRRCPRAARRHARRPRLPARDHHGILRPPPRGLRPTERFMTRHRCSIALAVLVAACGGAAARPTTTAVPAGRPPAGPATPPVATDATPVPPPPPPEPALPPAIAFMPGLMPLKDTGVDQFRLQHPTYDGRGVLIAILDTGVDPGVDGLMTTSTGAPKIVELRDFSGEGRVALAPVTPAADGTVAVGGHTLAGAHRIGRLTTASTWYAGMLRELALGKPPAGDLNGNGVNTDAFPVIVVKASDGWVAFLDSNLNGSFEDEMPLHDYRDGRETIALGSKPITIAANFSEADGAPLLDLFFDNGGQRTHTAGITPGRSPFKSSRFAGAAPGAPRLGLKVREAAPRGASVTGSMQRAMGYAARYAEQRNMPLVLNLSFGVGNEREGHAVIDSIVNAFLAAHPAVVFTISAGNDGPGLSTLGFPASADLALSVGASYPGAFARPVQPGTSPAPDVMGWWSSRGAELAQPDIVTPGLSFSSVPRWDTGNEIKGGTSMAAPHAAGLAAFPG